MGPHRPNGGGMMPGVVAGFPRKAAQASITLVAAYDGPDWGGYEAGNFGSISPAGASAIPGAPAIEGANGEILAVLYERYEGIVHRLYIEVRGDYSAPPFTSLQIDGGTPLTGFFRYGTRWALYPLASNPIPAGTHTLVFS